MVIRHYHVDKHSLTYDELAENTIQMQIPIIFNTYPTSISIASTGVKTSRGRIKITSEMVKHLKSAILVAFADTPSATDATVAIELYDYTTSTVLASVTFSGAGGYAETTISADTIKNIVDHEIGVRFNVTTASATSGASQTFYTVALHLVLGIS